MSAAPSTGRSRSRTIRASGIASTHAGLDPTVELRVRRAEDATGQHDVDGPARDAQLPGDGDGHRRQLVGEPVQDPASDRVALRGDLEHERRQLLEPARRPSCPRTSGARRRSGASRRAAAGRAVPARSPARARRALERPPRALRARFPGRRPSRPTGRRSRPAEPSVRPVRRPAAFTPAPQMTTMPQPSGAPARRDANASLWTATRSATPAPAKAAVNARTSAGKSAPATQNTPRLGLGRHAGRARGPRVEVGEARHGHVHRHLLVRDRRPVDEREQLAGARDEGQVDLRVAPVDGEDGGAAPAHPIGAASGGCGWPTGVSPSGRSSSSRPTNRAPSARSRSTISASAGATGSGQVWSSRIAPSPCASTPSTARPAISSAVRPGIPLVDLHVPADVPVAELAQALDEVGAVRAGAERKARPRPSGRCRSSR